MKWEDVDWAGLQSRCVGENVDRFDMLPRPIPGETSYQKFRSASHRGNGILKSRSAIVFRSYDGFTYKEDMLRVMRSVIQELALGSGGEYEAFLLVQVKDTTIPIFDDADSYEEVVRNSVPKEFQNMTVLWNAALWSKLYPKVPEHSRE